ncbi:MAG TPA: ParA family protein [Lacibacter sp.]|mgnify:CR=1 FL=1|nr:ParA family protein [Lacibacter sp.]HMO88403.1 ParA family protein [Lacibacter sp.]HMP87292.1 ParA family protein [Lacibacter sp.]
MFTFALFNLKGGVGKTASCVNFAYLAARDGYKTLLWDIDPQGATSFYYNVKPKQRVAIREVVGKDAAGLADFIRGTEYENLDIIPADSTGKALDILLEEMKTSKKRIAHLLRQLKQEYDFVFVDCPPGLSALAENIFHGSDIVLMPVIPTTLSVRTYNMVKDFFKEKDIDLKKMTCFFTMVDLRRNMHNEVMEELYRDKRFFDNYIPYLSDVEKMGVHQAPLEEYARSSYAAQCYRDLWEEIKEGVL